MSKREHKVGEEASEDANAPIKSPRFMLQDDLFVFDDLGSNTSDPDKPTTLSDTDDDLGSYGSSLVNIVPSQTLSQASSSAQLPAGISPVSSQINLTQASSQSAFDKNQEGVFSGSFGEEFRSNSWSSEDIRDGLLPDFNNDVASDEAFVEDDKYQKLKICVEIAEQDEEFAGQVVGMILNSKVMMRELLNQLGKKTSSDMKQSLKSSKLTGDKKNRNYLLEISPLDLCKEFQTMNEDSFNVVIKVLLGIKDAEDVFKSQFLLNNICAIYSTVARILNRNATGYALLLGVMARDGGLREESLKIFPQLCHVRTLQKYDRVLEMNSKDSLMQKLDSEKKFHVNLKNAKEKVADLSEEGTIDELQAAETELKEIQSQHPKFLTTVWDNLNLRGERRHDRTGDLWSDFNHDFMTSLHITERIDATHMDNSGKAFKKPQDLSIEDFVPGDNELELIFNSLIAMYSHSLVNRHPVVFKSLRKAIKDYSPHQFHEEMQKKSEEFTGDIYEKSECKTEELISMILAYQEKMVHINNDGVCGKGDQGWFAFLLPWSPSGAGFPPRS